MSTFSKTLQENQWASYFHQVSVGTHFSEVVPTSSLDIAENVNKFFFGLPSATIVNITMLRGEYTKLLQELLGHPTCSTWMLVSRFSSKSKPVVMLRPVDLIS